VVGRALRARPTVARTVDALSQGNPMRLPCNSRLSAI